MNFATALGLLILGIAIGTMFGHAVGYGRAIDLAKRAGYRPRYRRSVTRSE